MTIYYKAFEKDLSCLGYRFVEGETYEVEGSPRLCAHGFHFCEDLLSTLPYYPERKTNKYAEVEVLGEVIWDSLKLKGVTNKIKILRVLSDEEAALLLEGGYFNSGNHNSGDRNSGNHNSGHHNSGHYNAGNHNSGNHNSGDYNSGNNNPGHCNPGHCNPGHCNSGNYNSGDHNPGDHNPGDYNSGDHNSGDHNSGDYNSGDYNSGDYNSGDYNVGHFNTQTPATIQVFNKPCSLKEWEKARIPECLDFEVVDGDYKASFTKAMSEATLEQIEQLKKLPNFDADVFFEISGWRE